VSGRVVFIGDSITDCDRRTDPFGLGSGYVDIVASALRHRGDGASIVNRGLSGDRIAHLQERWQRDVLAYGPEVVSIFVGVNDTLVTFYEGRPTPTDLFEQRYTDILERTQVAGVRKVIVVDPFFVGTDSPSAPWREGSEFAREDLDLKRPIVRRLAKRYGAAFVALQDAVDQAVAERGPSVVAPDGVHPSAFGHLLIARLWLEAYGKLGP
jgi:acyl-CoA thioesterase I